MKTYNVAILGCGRIARHNGLAAQLAPGINLKAVCDLDENKAESLGVELNTQYFTNYHKMFRSCPDIDLVTICTPSGMHFEHAIEVISRYKKNVIVEKPTFMTLQQLEIAYRHAVEQNVTIFPVFQNRYNKAVSFVYSELKRNQLGEIRIVNVTLRWCRPQKYYDLSPWRGTFSHDGGVITNQGIHHIDLLLHLGGRIERVYSRMRTLGAEIEVEDTALALVEFENDAIGSIEATTAARPDDFEASITIIGEGGMAKIGGIAVNELEIYTPAPDACEQHSEQFSGIAGFGAVYGYGHQQMYRDIYQHLERAAQYPITKKECQNTLSLLHALYRSDEIGTWACPGDMTDSIRLGRDNPEVSNLYRIEVEA